MDVGIGPVRPDEHEAAFQLRVRTFTAQQSATYDPDAPYMPADRRLVARLGDRVVGHLGVWPFQQTFGGRAVAMGGVGGVAIAADQRGRGVGSALLACGLELMRERGDVVSTLYPATVAPYRAWGWALAGHRLVRTVPTRALASLPRPTDDVSIRPGTEDDVAVCAALARTVVATEPGGLHGTDDWYRRAIAVGQAGTDGDGFDVAVVDDEVAGFATWSRATADGFGWRLDVGLVVGRSAAVERALWRQLGSWWSVAPTTRLVSWPTDPLVVDLPEHDTRVHEEELWMTRLVDVAGAVAARGWAPVRGVAVPLRVHDDRVAANDGAFVLEVEDGVGALTPGGPGRVEVDVRDLAALWTGFTPASALARRGGLPGATEADVQQLGWAFDGPTPWMREYF